MPKAKYQLEDFLALVNSDYRNYVHTVHEMMLQAGYKMKIQVTKLYGLHVSYWQPGVKTVKGIIVYFLVKDGKLMMRINADNYASYLGVLNRLPENMLSQMDRASDCLKAVDPQKCWQGCGGYDFHIGDRHYQKCLTDCFLLVVDCDSFPFLVELLEGEIGGRGVG